MLTPEAMEVNRMTFSDPYRTIIVEPAREPAAPERQPAPEERPEPEPRREPEPKRRPAPAKSEVAR